MNSSDKKVVIIGSTGLIGGHLVEQLQQNPAIGQILLPVRRQVNFSQSKAMTVEVDFTDKEALRACVKGADAIFCAIGTTQQRVNGDKRLYKTIDFDIPVLVAKLCEEESVQYFAIVSSVGADSQSNNFYLQLKGDVEQAVQAFKIERIAIFRPSMLLGERKEFRLMEKVSKHIMQVFAFLIPKRYKGVQAAQVAKTMIQDAFRHHKGVQIYENEAILSAH